MVPEMTITATFPPALKVDADRSIRPDGWADRFVIWNMIAHLASHGWVPDAVDSDEHTPAHSAVEMMEQVFNLDDAWLHFTKDGVVHSVYVVLGNGGWDAISDYRFKRDDADGFDAVMLAYEPETLLRDGITKAGWGGARRTDMLTSEDGEPDGPGWVLVDEAGTVHFASIPFDTKEEAERQARALESGGRGRFMAVELTDEDEDEDEDEGCPKGDPGCDGPDDGCHDACVNPETASANKARRTAMGNAAMVAGSEEPGETASAIGDTVANILHAAVDRGLSIEEARKAVQDGIEHFEYEHECNHEE